MIMVLIQTQFYLYSMNVQIINDIFYWLRNTYISYTGRDHYFTIIIRCWNFALGHAYIFIVRRKFYSNADFVITFVFDGKFSTNFTKYQSNRQKYIFPLSEIFNTRDICWFECYLTLQAWHKFISRYHPGYQRMLENWRSLPIYK